MFTLLLQCNWATFLTGFKWNALCFFSVPAACCDEQLIIALDWTIKKCNRLLVSVHGESLTGRRETSKYHKLKHYESIYTEVFFLQSQCRQQCASYKTTTINMHECAKEMDWWVFKIKSRIVTSGKGWITHFFPEPHFDVVLMKELHPPQQNTVTLHIHYL